MTDSFKKSQKIFKLLICISLALVGCKARRNDSQIKGIELSSNTVLIVASGGWMSCATSRGGLVTTPIKSWIYDSLLAVVEDIGKITNQKVEYLVSCLGMRAPTGILAPLWYVTQESNSSYRIRAKDFPNVVAEHISRTKPDKVYLVGHSFGGWVISDALERGDFRADSAFGLDFIDAHKCVVIDGLDGDYGAGCREAPNFKYATILRKLSKTFYNIWQSKGPIHSAPIDVSGSSNYENIEWDVTHPKLIDQSYAHRFIGFDADLWQTVCSKIAIEVGGNDNSCRKIETNELGHAIGSNSSGFTVDQSKSAQGKDPIDDAKSAEGAAQIICEKTTSEGIHWQVEIKDGDGDGEFVLTAKRGNEQLYGAASVAATLFRRIGDGGVQFRSSKGTITLDLTSGALPVTGKFITERYNKEVNQLQCRAGTGAVASASNTTNLVSQKTCTKTTSNGIVWSISLKAVGNDEFELTAQRGNQPLYGSNVPDGNVRLKRRGEPGGFIYISDRGTVWLRTPISGAPSFTTQKYDYNVTDLQCVN